MSVSLTDVTTQVFDFFRQQDFSSLQYDGFILYSSAYRHHLKHFQNSPEIPYNKIPGISQENGGVLFCADINQTQILCIETQLHRDDVQRLNLAKSTVRYARELGLKKGFVLAKAHNSNHPEKNRIMKFGVLIDHINLTGTNPLMGKNDDKYGSRFPDMTTVYQEGVQRRLVEFLNETKIAYERGMLVALPANQSEITQEEISALGSLEPIFFTDNSIHEIIAAHHAGLILGGIITRQEIHEPHITELLRGVVNKIF